MLQLQSFTPPCWELATKNTTVKNEKFRMTTVKQIHVIDLLSNIIVRISKFSKLNLQYSLTCYWYYPYQFAN